MDNGSCDAWLGHVLTKNDDERVKEFVLLVRLGAITVPRYIPINGTESICTQDSFYADTDRKVACNACHRSAMELLDAFYSKENGDDQV